MKRVALYYPWIHLRSGVERMILEILRRSRHRFTVFTSHLDPDGTFPELRGRGDVVELRRVSVRRSLAAALGAALTIWRERLPLAGYDALLVSSEGLGDLIAFQNHAVPVIAYCHSLARPAYDATYRAALLARRPALRWTLPPFLPAYRAVTRRAWQYYRHVFANSRTTREQILAHGLRPAGAVEVLHPGVDLARARPDAPAEPYFLYAGRIKWTKNVELAVAAFRAFRARAGNGGGPWSLVVAGEVDGDSAAYLRQLRELGSETDGVEYRVNPTQAELEDLYARCHALLFPSLSEPWGIVPVEAMAFGRPVLAVNRGGPAESVVDGVTGFLLEPSADAFAARMAWLAERPDAARRMGLAGHERAREFSWDAFVTRLDDYLAQHC